MIKSVVTGQAGSSHCQELRNTPGKTPTNQTWYTHISQLTQFMPPPETYKSEIGSQPRMSQVHTGAYVSLIEPGKTEYTACHPRKTTTYILHVVLITTHTHDRRKSIGKKKTKTRKDKGKERKGRTSKRKNEKGKEKKRKDKKSKKEQDKRRQGKEKRKKCHTSRP